jgi:hypothetical protein
VTCAEPIFLRVAGEAEGHLDEIITAFALLQHRMQMETKAAVGDIKMVFVVDVGLVTIHSGRGIASAQL